MSYNLNSNASEGGFCRGPSDEEIQLYALRDGLLLIRTEEAKRVLDEMAKDMAAKIYDVGRYLARYEELGGNGDWKKGLKKEETR